MADRYEQLAATKALLTAYFGARTQAELDAAEARVRDRSIGAIAAAASVRSARHGEGRWMGALAVAANGIRSHVHFGDGDFERLIRIAHLELGVAIDHPGGGKTRTIPIIGPDLRPPTERDGTFGESACDVLYGELGALNRYATQAAGTIMEGEVTTRMALALGKLAAGWQADREWDAWSAADGVVAATPIEPPPQDPMSTSTSASQICLLGDGTGLVAYLHALVRFRVHDGEVLRVYGTRRTEFLAAPTAELALLCGDIETGDTVDVDALAHEATRNVMAQLGADPDTLEPEDYGGDQPERVARTFGLDLTTGAWTAARPEGLRVVRFSEGQEQAFLLDDGGRGLQLRHLGDYPAMSTFSPDRAWFWIEDSEGSGGIYRTIDGALVTMRYPQCWDDLADVPHLTEAGELAPPDEREDELAYRDRAAAIVRTPRRRWLTFAFGVVAENWHPLVVVDGPTDLAAFDLEGTTLAVVTAGTVRIIDLTSLRQTSAWPLAPIDEAASELAQASEIDD